MTREGLAERDRRDPLAPLRGRFHLPEGLLYFDGNSLGPVVHGAADRVRQVMDRQWGDDLIRSWNVHGWIDLPRRVAARIAPLIGASEDEVAVTDTTSVNLFKLLAAAAKLKAGRRVILSETAQFPTDIYMAQGLADLLGDGYEVRLARPGELEAAIDDDVAVVCLSHVRFKSGELLDMPRITRQAHDQGAFVLWDLSHSAGALEVDLGGAGVDFAVGCGYKFLSGGPGAPAFLYVARRLHEQVNSPLAGWLGHRSPFDFDLEYRPAPGVGRFLCGTPPILSLAALDEALNAFEGVDMAAVRDKSMALGELFLELVRRECDGLGLGIACPAEAAGRGSQIALSHPDGYAIVQALIDRRVVPDFRAPDILRFGLTPLYQRFVDVWDAVQILRGILENRTWDQSKYHQRSKVT